MSLTIKERIKREKQRREVTNALIREKVAAARRCGICRCGGKLDKKPDTKRNYSTCPDCREKATVSVSRGYREGPLPPRMSPLAKLDGRRFADATILVPVTAEGQTPEIAFDPKYLADALEIGPTLRLLDNLHPGVTTGPSGNFRVLMSLRFTERTAKEEATSETPAPPSPPDFGIVERHCRPTPFLQSC